MKQEDTQREIRKLEARLSLLDQSRRKHRDDYGAGKLPVEIFREGYDEIKREMLETQLLLSEKRQNILELDNVIESAFAMLTMIDKAWLNADSSLPRQIQRAIFPDGLVYSQEDGFRTPVTSKAFNILDLLNAPDDHLVPPTGLEPMHPAPEAGALST